MTRSARCDIGTCIQSRCQDFAQEGVTGYFQPCEIVFQARFFQCNAHGSYRPCSPGGRVRHQVAFADVALRGKDVEDRTEAQAQKVWTLEDMRWCVRSDPADRTPNGRAAGVAALLALIGGTSTDAVMILLRASPVAHPELMDVHLLLYGGAPHRRGGSLSAMIERYQPFGRPASQLLFALRAVAPARVRASNGVSCCMSTVASLVRASACLLPGSPQCAGTH